MTAPNFAPGTPVAGKFTIRSLLGYGGSTATFRAVSSDGREVALKAYAPMIGQRPDLMGQLQHYVAATNALPADLCTPILEAGYDQTTAAPFTVTEFVHNPSVAQLVMRRPMSPDEVSAMLRTLAAVLDAAHTRDIFHLGIKPTNLFVDASGPGNLKVNDFGTILARNALPTQEGYMTSAPWMAPEQVQGGVPPSAATDIFSAALVAFYALVGRPYWRSCQGTPDIAAWQREVMSPRTPASARAQELGAPLDPGLDPIFARALAIDPRERYRSMTEFAASFGGFPSGLGQAMTLAIPAQSSAYAVDPGPPRPQGGDAAMGGYPSVDALRGLAPGMAGAGAMGGGAMGGAPGMPGVPATAAGPEMPPSALQTHVPMPGGMGAGPGGPPRTASGRAMPIVVGVAAVLLAVGAASAWWLIGSSDDTPTPVASTSASAEQPPVPATTATEVAAPTPPPDTPPPTPALDDAGTPPDDAAPAAPETVSVKVTCKPEDCEEITINNKVESGDLQLAPGSYRLGVKRTGYFPRVETIVVEAGKPLEKEVTLTVAKATTPSTPTGNTTAAPSKNCGKFLKKCK
ncbi:serine/threonine protein kinase [Chondromyces apiculatus]|uniref:Protein kinase n=1 Tax=Chondromyces apiculatus DSM 436 TaxID=1192034 RepID=A0A017T7S1_9BACT|nr:serine/threonine-protein kinase [Chondromyces apiculatus]EYF05289.1 protein kinase [Chondromyces apiculatus DSM 436]